MNNLKTVIAKEAEEEFSYARDLRRDLHRHPEVAREEFRTAEVIERELISFGLAPRRVGETGVYAEIAGTAGVQTGEVPTDAAADPDGAGTGKAAAKTILLRADIDALPVAEEHECEYQSEIPGKMHACGHDAHTASLLTAAKILARHRDEFAGTIRLVFQQAEEIGYGARIFIDEGLADGADRCFGTHTASNVPVGKVVLMPGPNNASVDWFRIRVHGKAAHVSTPEQGVDAVYIAGSIVTEIQSYLARRFNPMEPVLIGIGKLTAGTTYNIVAGEAEMEGTIRAMTAEARSAAKAGLELVARTQTEAFGGTVDFEWKDYTSALINDPAAAAEAGRTAAELFGAENVITQRTPALGGDDFAEFILRVPGAYAYIGTANEEIPETMAAQHNGHFDIDERGLIVAAKLYAAYAIDVLTGA